MEERFSWARCCQSMTITRCECMDLWVSRNYPDEGRGLHRINMLTLASLSTAQVHR